MKENRSPQIGDVYLMRFSGANNEQSGWRPGLVFQNNVGNCHSPNIIALPLTSKVKKIGQPTHVFLSAEKTGLKMDSMVLCENPERLSKKNLGQYLTSLSSQDMADIATANLLASSAIAFIDPGSLISIWHAASKLNMISQ